jgi:hypothetical protein
MLLCMRTTIDIPDTLFKRAKKAAAEQGVALREIVLRALRTHLDQPAAQGAGYSFDWKVDQGPWNPDLPLHSREALEEYLDSWRGDIYG